MRKTSEKEIAAAVKLDGGARYSHFVKRVADEERAWGLWKDGWAIMATGEGSPVLPLWPAKEYAELCRVADWTDYEAREISLETLLSEVGPRVEAQQLQFGVFPTAEGRGVAQSSAQLLDALREELKNYD